MYYRKAFDKFKGLDELVLLGSRSVQRLPIFSFLIKHLDSGLYLHHNFVSSLLSDLFGIQTRGGCACAGPYAQASQTRGSCACVGMCAQTSKK